MELLTSQDDSFVGGFISNHLSWHAKNLKFDIYAKYKDVITKSTVNPQTSRYKKYTFKHSRKVKNNFVDEYGNWMSRYCFKNNDMLLVSLS